MSYIPISEEDEDFIPLLRQGNRQAFEGIYRKYAGDLYRYARRNISLKEDCEEIVQDVFESLWKRREELGQVTALSAYLFRMVKYKIIRYFQNSLIRKKYDEHYRIFEAVYDTIPEYYEGLSVTTIIDRSISKLPQRCQLAFRLRLHENLSNGEIAERMNITKKTVEAYMLKAFDHLRRHRKELIRTRQ